MLKVRLTIFDGNVAVILHCCCSRNVRQGFSNNAQKIPNEQNINQINQYLPIVCVLFINNHSIINNLELNHFDPEKQNITKTYSKICFSFGQIA